MVDNQILEKQEKTLNELWGENQVVLCLRNAKQIVKAFKESNMKDNNDTLIFNFYDWEYRKAGDQKNSKMIPSVKRVVQK